MVDLLVRRADPRGRNELAAFRRVSAVGRLFLYRSDRDGDAAVKPRMGFAPVPRFGRRLGQGRDDVLELPANGDAPRADRSSRRPGRSFSSFLKLSWKQASSHAPICRPEASEITERKNLPARGAVPSLRAAGGPACGDALDDP
jgi:hypothetical protein